MQISIRKDCGKEYLLIKTENTPMSTDYRLKMLVENKIKGFADCSVKQLDNESLFYYEIPKGFVSLEEYSERKPVSGDFFKGLFYSLAESVEEIREYLLDEDDILLSISTVYLAEKDKSFLFVYCPIEGEGFQSSCRRFAETLLNRLDYSDKAAVDAGYDFYRTCIKEEIGTQELKQLCFKTGRAYEERTTEHIEKEEQVKNDDMSFLYEEEAETESKGLFSCIKAMLFRCKERIRKRKVPAADEKREGRRKKAFTDIGYDLKEEEAKDDEDYISDELFGDNEETILLNEGQEPSVKAWLIPQDNNDSGSILLSEEQYVIGKKGADADISISSGAVSRRHAKLIYRNGAYAVSDTGSKNGTYLNERKIKAEELFTLEHRDIIRFADSEYMICYCDDEETEELTTAPEAQAPDDKYSFIDRFGLWPNK